MIPILRCSSSESAANLLVQFFPRVLIQAHYDNYTRVRFRPDALRDERVFFGKVPSQIKRWHERGGCLVSWRRVDAMEGAHDAIVFAECPKSMDALYVATRLTSCLCVVWEPPTWRLHEETIAKRHREAHPSRYARQVRKLAIIRGVIEAAPTLTRDYLERRYARGSSRALPAPAPPADAATPSDTAH